MDSKAYRYSVIAATALAALILILGWTLKTPALGESGGTPVARTTICTEIGCSSLFGLDLGPAKRSHRQAAKARVCVDGICRTVDLTKKRPRATVRIKSKGPTAAVLVTLLGRGGKVLDRQSIEAPVSVNRPNGPDCPPACFYIRARLDDDGQLVAIPN